jgi:antitoxin FitA
MAQLLVRNVSEEIAKLLKKRAAEHGVSAEEEHRRILQEVLGQEEKNDNEARTCRLLNIPSSAECGEEDDWIFDRNDPRIARPWRREQGLFDD